MAAMAFQPCLLPTPAWEWSDTTRYFREDVVRHAGVSWFLTSPVSTGEEPGVAGVWRALGWVSDIALPDVGPTQETGGAARTLVLATDAKGRVTSASAIPIQIPIAQVADLAATLESLEAAVTPVDGVTVRYDGSGKLQAIGIAGVLGDAHLAESYLKADGSRALLADLSVGGHRLTHVADPTSAQDAATKAYIDAALASLAPSFSVRQDAFVGDGSNTPTYALSAIPSGGLLLSCQTAGWSKAPADDYSVAGGSLTLTYSPAVGEKTVVSYLA